MVWPFLPVASSPNFQWAGPTHTVLELREAKHRLDSGGIVYVCRSPGEIAAVVARGPHERTSVAGTLLNVSTHASLSLSNPLAREIDQEGACFIWRTALPHESVPTVRYYSFARSHRLDTQTTRAPQAMLQIAVLWPGLKSAITHTTFMFPQGWLTGVALRARYWLFRLLP